MKVPRIVLDTNVVVSALRARRGASFRLLSVVGKGRFEICVSVSLVLEYEDAVGRHRAENGLTSSQLGDVLDYLCSVAIRQEVFSLWRPALRDSKDDLVLELAVAAQCSDVITSNLKDFAGSERFGVKARRPHELLAEIGAL